MGLEADLQLSTEQALSSVSSIDDAITNVVQNFKVGLAEALDLLQNPQPVDVTADASAVTADIDQAVTDADATVTPDAVTSGITDQIDEAVNSADVGVTPTADASDVTSSIDDSVAAADTTVVVEADTSQAEDALAGLGDAGSEAGKGLSDAAGGATDASGGLGLVGPAAGFAAGEMGELTGIVSKFGPEAAGAAAGGAALVSIGKDLFEGALEQQTAIERLNRTFGDTAEAVEHIQLGGINEDLDKLALETGSSVDGLRNFAASFGQLGIDSGHAKEEVAGTVDQIIALATRASVLNPTLGSADEIVGRLSTSLARGGRFLSNYQISLTSAEIQARALIDTGKQAPAMLTNFEKSAAGAEIATERLGDKLGKDITTGAQSDAIQVRRLGVELEEAKKKAGAGLVEPVTESMKALVPVVVDTIKLVGEGLTGALRAVEPELKAFAAAADFLGSSAGAGGGLGLFGSAVKNLIGQLNPLHQVDQVISLTQGHFSDFAHGLPAIGVAFDVFDKGKSKTEQLADQTKKLAEEQNQQAHATLIAAEASGQLSRDVEVAAIKQHTAKDGTVDWVGVLDQLQGEMTAASTKSDEYSDAVTKQAAATKEAQQGSQDLAEAQLGALVSTGQLTQGQLDHLAVLNLTKQGTADFVTILQQVSPAAAKVVADQAIIAGGLNTTATQFTLAKDEAALYSEQFDQMVGPFLNAEKAQDDFTDKVDAALSVYANASLGAKAYKDTIAEFIDPALAANEANIKLQDTIDKTNKTLTDNKGVVDERTKAGRDDEQAVIDLVRAYDSEIEALIASGESSKVVQGERQNEIDKLSDLKARYPGLSQSIDEYVGHLNQANTSGEEARRVTEAHRKALEDVITSGDKWIQTLIATGTNETGIASARQEEIDKLIALKAQYPELGGQIDTYIAKLQAIPPSKDTLINLPNTIQNEIDLSNIHQAIELLRERHLPVTVENVQNAINDAGAVKGSVESIPQNWPIGINVNTGNSIPAVSDLAGLLNTVANYDGRQIDIGVRETVQGTLIPPSAQGSSGGGQLGTGGMAGKAVTPFEIFPVNEQNPGTSELFVSSVPGRIVSKADAIDAIREAASISQPTFDVQALAVVLAKAFSAQRPFTVNAAPGMDEQAVADAVAARLGYEATR